MAKPWTEAEIRVLRWEWGTLDTAALAKRLGRPEGGVREKARTLGLGALSQGVHSLAEVARITGYDRDRILTAARRAGLHLKRVPRGRASPKRGRKGRHYAIDHDTLERILAELAKHPDGGRLWRTHTTEWGGRYRNGSAKPPACLGCGGTDRPHHSGGRCRPCYDRFMGYTAEDALRRKPRSRNRLGHPEPGLEQDGIGDVPVGGLVEADPGLGPGDLAKDGSRGTAAERGGDLAVEGVVGTEPV